ncbi:MAG: SAM-dependent methyltransferase [Culicoidibacterales bacterium]
MTENQWETTLCIQTSGDQTIFPTSEQYHRYEATPYADFVLLLEHYTPLPAVHFVDFGCGKGRLSFFMAAHSYPSTGIEMNSYLFDQACFNKQHFSTRFSQTEITFHCEFAQTYPIQALENTFYFFNPFDKRIFQQVIQQVLKSYRACPRALELILYYPSTDYLDYLDDCTEFTHKQTIICQPSDPRHRFVIYQLT